MLTIILLFIILFLICCIISEHYSYFSNRSILNPPIRSIVYGHLSDLWSANSYSEQLRQWTIQYGSIYGIFEGIRPVYVISDVKLLQEIFVTQFHRFYARRTPLINKILGDKRLHLFATNSNKEWKRQRMILNPAFSSLKLKQLTPIINSCIDIFIEQLSYEKTEILINILDFYKRLTMDMICRCAFGIDTKIQFDIKNENIYKKKIEEILEKDFERSYLARIHRIMPFSCLANLCSFIFHLKHRFQNDKSSLPPNLWLIEHMHLFIQQNSTNNLLQLMIDSLNSHKINFNIKNENKLSESELLSNAYLILSAGFETTSTALGYCTYRLSIHQDIQEKLYQEIILNKFNYLDIFIREVLRMHPIAIQPIHRQCMENTNIGNYFIEKNCLIQVDVLSVHYNNEYWGPQCVNEFHPERHLIKRHPLAFMPFGNGPRKCLGMRFAFLEIKLSLIRLINEYRILPSEENLNISEQFVLAPKNVFVKLQKRS